ncbi:hypothetical protein Btru_010789 [Bulinus truncatus]|nr:hypothetical protein Btru_010789 [Bulinus truncatus]
MNVEKLVKDHLCAAYYLESKPIVGRCMPSIFAKALDKAEALKDNLGNEIKRSNGEVVTGILVPEWNHVLHWCHHSSDLPADKCLPMFSCHGGHRLISEASVAISYMWCTLFWPLVPFVLQCLVIAYWISSMVYISSMGEPEYYNSTNEINTILARLPCDPSGNATLGDLCSFVRYGGDMYKTAMLIFMLFMFFWLMNFIIALEQITLAGAFASYYWAWDKSKDIPTFPLWSSFYRSLRYHTGSLAFGSLIIAIIQMIRAFLEYINRKLKGSENKVAKFILTCLRCCFWCLEKFLRYVNKNAYILIAIHGRNFCTAAKDGFMLIMRNVLRAAVVDKVCDFLMFISKLMITGAIAVMAFFWFQRKVPLFSEVVPEMNYFLFSVVLVVLGAYLIADSFFDVYSIAVDTIFLCFLEDIERNDGSSERPFYMNKNKNLKLSHLHIPKKQQRMN